MRDFEKTKYNLITQWIWPTYLNPFPIVMSHPGSGPGAIVLLKTIRNLETYLKTRISLMHKEDRSGLRTLDPKIPGLGR